MSHGFIATWTWNRSSVPAVRSASIPRSTSVNFMSSWPASEAGRSDVGSAPASVAKSARLGSSTSRTSATSSQSPSAVQRWTATVSVAGCGPVPKLAVPAIDPVTAGAVSGSATVTSSITPRGRGPG